ncbi:nitroreductase family deazaflavin-dependent oxidoreductase [Streptomyces sp. SID6673]|nr:nitroreductase family deazaflavin-dependent oxidoreductase [Streptomyces sp. SID11726]NDZ94733.1 nitroreductase family deazaflavin-dependent oxidoreductase [Streptomyces sp. SID11726]NEB22893.1 nitroreductase family deazaflavin-dependent oxidoreductase [Streptomyces sp. SID6673]
MKRRAFVLVNRAMNAVIGRIRPRRFRGADLLILTTTGRKTGTRRTTPLLYMPDGDRWIVVASNGGGDWEPGWWLNLKAGSPAEIAIGDAVTPVRGAEITGAEREQMWTTLNENVFDFQGYQDQVSRTIAVVALTPVS